MQNATEKLIYDTGKIDLKPYKVEWKSSNIFVFRKGELI